MGNVRHAAAPFLTGDWNPERFPGALPGGGHVLTIVIRGNQHAPDASFTPYNHYSMLRTIEDNWNLGCLANTCNTADVPAMNDLLDRRR